MSPDHCVRMPEFAPGEPCRWAVAHLLVAFDQSRLDASELQACTGRGTRALWAYLADFPRTVLDVLPDSKTRSRLAEAHAKTMLRMTGAEV